MGGNWILRLTSTLETKKYNEYHNEKKITKIVLVRTFNFNLIYVNVHSFQEWIDKSLAWNESDYDGIQAVRIPPTMIWRPDILMYNR